MKKILIVLFISTSLLFSCKRQIIPADDIELGKEYFPLTMGHTIEYAVDSILYNDFNSTVDTFRYEIKDEIGNEFIDNEGRTSYLVHRYKRQDASYAWADNLTYYITQTAFNIEVIESNLRFIKMVFPVKTNTKWDGNKFITTDVDELKWYNGWEYKYVNINESYNTGYINFPNTVTINEVDDVVGDTLDATKYSTRTFSRERYAKNVGLISREIVKWEYQNNAQAKFRNGFILIYNAKNYY